MLNFVCVCVSTCICNDHQYGSDGSGGECVGVSVLFACDRSCPNMGLFVSVQSVVPLEAPW